MKKLKFIFFIWGETYIKNFSEICCKFLIEELDNKFFDPYKISIEIWTKKASENTFNLNDFLNKKIEIEILDFSPLQNLFSLKNFNKYKILSILQRLSFIKNFKSNSLIFLLYPDFIWKIGSIIRIIKNIRNKTLAVAYAPQVIEENFFKRKEITKNINEFIYENLHDIVNHNAIDNKEKRASTAACLTYKKKNNIHFRNFHMHPVCINFKTKDINFLNNFFTSLDEDFIGKLKLNKKNTYLPKNSNEVMFASLFSKNAYESFKTSMKPFLIHYSWVKSFCSNNHIFFSNNKFHLKKKPSDKQTDDTKLNNYLKKIYQHKTNITNNYMKKINFVHNNQFSNSMLDFLHLEILECYKNKTLKNNINRIFKKYKFEKKTRKFLFNTIYKNLY